MKHDNIDDIYKGIINSVLSYGRDDASPRGMPTKELYNVGFKLSRAQNSIILNPTRKMNYAYAAIEMLGLMQHGKYNVEPYTWYNKQMLRYINEDTGEWDGSYATRLTVYKQLEKMYEILKDDPFSRRAVIGIYNPAHDFHDYESKDICCTLNFTFRVRNGRLNMTGMMRSNDILLGLPYDMTQFTFLQSVLACWLGLEMGDYYHFAVNLHAYEQDIPKLKAILADTDRDATQWKTMPMWDIADIEESYHQIEMLFYVDKMLRDAEAPTEEEAVKLFNHYKIDSNCLRKLYFDTIFPYLQKKLRNQK